MPLMLSHTEPLSLREATHGTARSMTPPLTAGEIHVWALPPETTEAHSFYPLLSPAERERAQRFRFPELSARYMADHARLRLLLAGYLDSDPQRLTFVENQQGKPRIAWPDCRLRFNLSHTKGMTLLAVCLDAEIGVDVEILRPVEDREAIAAMYFSPREVTALQEEPKSHRDLAFLRCWTRKEAYVKARGEGLSLPLDQFAVSLGERASLLHCQWDEHETSRWQMEDLHPGSAHVGALAVEQGAWSLQHYHWPSSGSPAGNIGDRA
ncbi:4'-phosphopantetheinyl transferase family protein [Silvibacterium dinghuense]|uniref:4'-phosphopantetheinyl transferase superfamily protein n=1 Tax=Silvibacterium dinghuense TaxID=1560006 RepID=A0A4Q1SGW0_9BACT|nr:4'-phosphopantetheinyl transferase superfamily protein [Silvibacterium dinghuense]RXS96756.1 4'-phosphopantetheinyl transferase superfamily protein [Silvibacterium dinghuense]GGG93388.1 hypothetical protein GCM10011586_05170 [Silvibacterium dinghuense]